MIFLKAKLNLPKVPDSLPTGKTTSPLKTLPHRKISSWQSWQEKIENKPLILPQICKLSPDKSELE